ncbi:circadian clock KaiB family protein [Phenylobacterium sp.]|uniref:circadian clock KaiB family protein n=1 Tax=Phenylobacterium sp. TaxID=1871053 RepID=UPI002DF44067|nr:circadian clock KaiB family protein [Phenylobacterium sp.]
MKPTPTASALRLVPADLGGEAARPGDFYGLTLYVAGETPKSLAAIANLRSLCETHLPGCHSIEVVDLAKNPELAAKDEIVAIPTLVRRLPAPIKRIIGSLADTEKVLIGLEVRSPPS